MSHGNARTTIHGRLLIVARHRQGWRQAHIAATMGISRRCVAKWVARFDADGVAGLQDRSSRPHRMPSRTPAEIEARVVRLRKAERRGRDWIAAELGVPARTVSRILARHQLPHLAMLDPMTGLMIRAAKTTAVRYERDRPGELVHMDVKKLGRIPDGGGWRAHGRVNVDRDPAKGPGYDYVHSLVDDHSRLAYSEILPDEKAPPAPDSSPAASPTSPPTAPSGSNDSSPTTPGPTATRCATCAPSSASPRSTSAPHCPWQNGKVERLNRTLAVEWAYRQPFTNNQQRADALAPLARALQH